MTDETKPDFLRANADIVIEAEQDDLQVRGNALASGDDAEDERVENAIIERLENGDVWAWALVAVWACWRGERGSDTLGACSYSDEKAFVADSGYYNDMVDGALSNLRGDIESYDSKIVALAEYVDCDLSEIHVGIRDNVFTINDCDWLICTESEADEEWDASLDNYIEECVLPEIPEQYQGYFDSEKWKRDAQTDGRAHSLALYDGEEIDLTDPVSGDEFVAFRLS